MITHDEARIEAVSYNCESIRIMLKYIAQQEKKDKLFEQLFNICKEYKCVSIGLSDDSEFLNVMSELEEGIK